MRGGQAAQQGRGAADRSQCGKAAGAIAQKLTQRRRRTLFGSCAVDIPVYRNLGRLCGLLRRDTRYLD